MRVLFDVFELTPDGGKSIGIYHYARNVWQQFVAVLPEGMSLVLACHGRNESDFPTASHPRIERVLLQDDTPRQWQRQRWLRWGAQALARQKGCDVYFTPKGFLPGMWGAPTGLRTCAVVHDLIPLWYAEHQPGYFPRMELAVLGRELRRTCRHADRLVTISEASADDILRRIPDARPSAVVYNGLPPAPRKVVSPERAPFIFAMASSYPHKNAQAVMDGYQRYRRQVADPLDLVVCGIDDPGQPGVTCLKGVSADVLHGHYQAAELFVFLSLVEGFGFPPLEAMQHGTPVLCSDLPVLRETTRGNAFFVSPVDADAVGAAIRHALADEQAEQRAHLRHRAQDVVASYSWQQCARGLLNQLGALA
jgi:glycosyltransferase involved in cell wall biosynthesis